MDSTLITCSKCKEERPLAHFYKNKTKKSGHYSACKFCYQEHQKKYRGDRDKLDDDLVDYWRIITYLRSARVPIKNCNKMELIAEWNAATTWYIPRMSQRRSPLKSYALNFAE